MALATKQIQGSYLQAAFAQASIGGINTGNGMIGGDIGAAPGSQSPESVQSDQIPGLPLQGFIPGGPKPSFQGAGPSGIQGQQHQFLGYPGMPQRIMGYPGVEQIMQPSLMNLMIMGLGPMIHQGMIQQHSQ